MFEQSLRLQVLEQVETLKPHDLEKASRDIEDHRP
jgi:hypothetical protein